MTDTQIDLQDGLMVALFAGVLYFAYRIYNTGETATDAVTNPFSTATDAGSHLYEDFEDSTPSWMSYGGLDAMSDGADFVSGLDINPSLPDLDLLESEIEQEIEMSFEEQMEQLQEDMGEYYSDQYDFLDDDYVHDPDMGLEEFDDAWWSPSDMLEDEDETTDFGDAWWSPSDMLGDEDETTDFGGDFGL